MEDEITTVSKIRRDWAQETLEKRINEISKDFAQHILSPRANHEHLRMRLKEEIESIAFAYHHSLEDIRQSEIMMREKSPAPGPEPQGS